MNTFSRTQSSHRKPLAHHRLRVYWRALKFAELVAKHPIKRASLRAQANDASDSVALNIAEGAGVDGKRGKQHFRISRGSTIEVVSAYEVAVRKGEEHPLELFLEEGHALVSMLTGLIL